MVGMVASGVYDVVLASRILGERREREGCRSTRTLTALQNLFTGAKLSEYHSGFRAFRSEVLRTLPLLENSDRFVFDNEILAQCIHLGYRIGEISCPTKYFREESSINFRRSVT
jgi:hypothetical protein